MSYQSRNPPTSAISITSPNSSGELVIGVGDTIKRRRGEKIMAKGIYRDPVRSSQSHFVKASGLRWLCSMLLVTILWAGCVWGLPFLTVLCPSERYDAERRRQHQRLTDRAWQMTRLIACWLPDRELIFVGDSSFAVLDLLYLVSSTPKIDLITRLLQILSWFVRRWRMEVNFEEARAQIGIETQRQWSDLAIARTTPVLFGLFSLVTLMANHLINDQVKPVRTAAWYAKKQPTFSDAIAIVRRCLWSSYHFSTSGRKSDVLKVPRSLLERLTDAVCYAA